MKVAAAYGRRAFVARVSGFGLGSALLPRTLWAGAFRGGDITAASIAAAEELAGLGFDDSQREMMVDGVRRQKARLDLLHRSVLDHTTPPAIGFRPLLPGRTPPAPTTQRTRRAPVVTPPLPANLEELAFEPVTVLSELIRRRRVSSLQLTRMYLQRLERHDPVLKCVVSLTADRALAQAAERDAELARGRWRGPLHGIPWGAKDLLAVRGYRTTWGAGPFREQRIDTDATVVRRLDEAGAVLVAKLTLGELAMGDVWFGGRTNNPWNIEQGSSGSSAGSAAAIAAGLVGFAIGTETLGSISSPATRCGTIGLRPTFGRVPRTGAMPLSWSMDKIGPICRSVEDCALVLQAINGPDGSDPDAIAADFVWDAQRPLRTLRVGYFQKAFDLPERDPANAERVLHATKQFDDAALSVLRGLGVSLIPVEEPDLPYDAMRIILTAEAAAAFDELTRSGRDRELVQQGAGDWANTFRVARFIPAADYINANRWRSRAVAAWDGLFREVDVIASPTFAVGFQQLVATNLTGHPAVILPNGFNANGTPVSLTFLGGLFQEANLLAVAHAYQQATDFHRRRPPAFGPG
jgi:Asp-tRNA(Asn)/Glu-tRNA(Gln) amidotransferase A subunit family amidase